MLKYVPFAEKAGMVFIGETEGNLARVHKDMEYLVRNAQRVKGGEIVLEDSCGIVDQQVARMDKAIQLMERERMSSEELVSRLRTLSQESVLRDFALFHGIVSLPKPTYLKGLNAQASRFVRKRASKVAPQNGRKPPEVCIEPLARPISFRDLTVTFLSHVRRTRRTHAVQQAFDISPDDIKSTVVKGLSLEIQPGEIVLIVGPSGSGKTTILNLLKSTGKQSTTAIVEGQLQYPGNCLIGTFQEILSRSPLIEIIGEQDVQSSLCLLGLAGLSEPTLYLKRFDELSKGQQYRAMLAKLIATRSNAWLADEFCANLDPVTANVVAHNVQRTARKLGITVIAATSHCETFLFSLRPDRVLALTSAWEHDVLSGREYMKAVSQVRAWDVSIPRLRLLPEFFDAIRSGRKHTTIRLGRKWYQPGLMLFESDFDNLAVNITEVVHKKFSDLTKSDAHDDGLKNLNLLKKTLRAIYPNIYDDSYLTILRFKLLCREEE
jgi:ABC-type lipoprotein export system ATPase subunit